MGDDVPPRPHTTYAGTYCPGLQGGARARITCRTSNEHGGISELVLASGPRALLDWETTPDKANVAAAVLAHWLGRAATPPELREFLGQLAADWVAGQP